MSNQTKKGIVENIAQMVPLISVGWYRYQSTDIHAVKGCLARLRDASLAAMDKGADCIL